MMLESAKFTSVPAVVMRFCLSLKICGKCSKCSSCTCVCVWCVTLTMPSA